MLGLPYVDALNLLRPQGWRTLLNVLISNIFKGSLVIVTKETRQGTVKWSHPCNNTMIAQKTSLRKQNIVSSIPHKVFLNQSNSSLHYFLMFTNLDHLALANVENLWNMPNLSSHKIFWYCADLKAPHEREFRTKLVFD